MPKKRTSSGNGVRKKRKNFRLPFALTTWAERYAKRKNTNLTQIIVDHLTALKEEESR